MKWPISGSDPHEGEEGWYDKLWLWHAGLMPVFIATNHTEASDERLTTATSIKIKEA